MHGLNWTQQQRFTSTIASFSRISRQKVRKIFVWWHPWRSKHGWYQFDNRNSRPPTGRITVKENGKPISDLKLTNNKSDVLTFGLYKRFLGILSHFLSIQLIKEVPLGNIPDVKDVRDGQNHKVFHNHRMFLSLSPGLSSSQKLTWRPSKHL